MATNYLRQFPVSHGRKVCSLYKKACREIEANIFHRHDRFLERRYQQILLRDRFDKNKQLDPDDAKIALEEGLKELKAYEMPLRLQFPNSPGGTNFGRQYREEDYVLDAWHPLEKAQYPEYFARRDVRKREFLEREELKQIEYEKEQKKIEGEY